MSQEKRYATQIKKFFTLLGYYQIAGGIGGIGLVFWLSFQMALNLVLLGLGLAWIALFAYSIYSGYLLLKQREKGLLHSQINQALQILHFTIMGFSFEYASGMAVLVGFDLSQDTILLLNFNFSAFQFKLQQNTETFKFQINLVAILLIILLEKLKEKIEERKQLLEASSE